MKLQKQLSRKFKGKEYVKWIITIPPEDIDKLGWEEGQTLKSEIREDNLIIKKSIEFKYTEFKSKILELVNSRPSGFMWQEIREDLNLTQIVPNNKWVSRLEKEINLKRRKEGTTTYWYTEKKGITVYNIGYEGKKLSELINILKKYKVKCLIDVRELALSRKNGYSKSTLNSILKESGIVYKHFSPLGSPRDIRHKLWNERNYEEFFNEYSKWLLSPDAHEKLVDLEGLVQVRTTAIMCFEKDVEKCHRSIIKKHLIEDGFKVVDL